MTRLYFLCPNTRRWFSTTFEKVPLDGPIEGLFTINHCRYCESVHRYKGSEARRLRPASQPSPKLGLKAKPRGKKLVARRRPLSFATPKLKDPCYGPLTDASQKEAEEAHGSGSLFMLEGKVRCTCGKMVGAKQSMMGGYFEPDPRPHERYKEPREPPRKRGPYKRM
jgi:hypothetical protein